MIYCKELDQNFCSKTELFKAIIANKEEIIKIKKSAIKYSDASPLSLLKDENVEKGSKKDEVKIDIGSYIYPVINTTNIFDSHRDVHLKGIWDKSVDMQQGKTYLVSNHDLKLGSVIAYPKDVHIMVVDTTFKDLGSYLDGTTQALIFKSKLTEKSNKDAFFAYQDKEDIQHSIRMQYVKMALAVNDSDPEMKEYKAEFDLHIDSIANKEAAIEEGYFWAIYEAKISKEGSAVLFGSNEITPTLYQPPTSTGRKTESPASIQTDHKKFINPNLY